MIETAREVLRATPRDDDEDLGVSEDALALGFAAEHAKTLRYVAATARWMRYEGGCWREDTKLAAFDAVRTYVRAVVAVAPELPPNKATALRSAKTVNAVAQLARADARLAAAPDQFDADPWLLNTPGGVVDLRTGVLGPHCPGQYHTRQTTATPSADAVAGCPRWHRHLEHVAGGDPALPRYLQKVMGYALTGSIREHAIFFIYGPGGAGKGVFLNTVHALLGTYARTAPIETFTASIGERHPTELAMLRGARLVTAQETEEGRRWAEAKLKAISGGDTIAARFMRGDFFEYRPQFKLVIAGNHRPHLRTVDEAMRRRLHVVPFEHTVPAASKDLSLEERLRDEWPGILAWAVKGCQLWLEEELRPPALVQSATAEYFTDEDALGAWLRECCTTGPGAEVSSADLFTSWSAWAERAGEPVRTRRGFADALRSRGFERKLIGAMRLSGFAGLTLRGAASLGPSYRSAA